MNHFVEISGDGVALFRRLPAEISQALDRLETASENSIHAFQDFYRLFAFPRNVTKFVAIELEGIQQILQIVSNARRHLTKGSELLRANESILREPQIIECFLK